MRQASVCSRPRGHHGVAVDEIVAAADCNRRMPYHYFGDTEGLRIAQQMVLAHLGLAGRR